MLHKTALGGCSSPSPRPWARRWRSTNVCDAWPVRRQTYCYLPSRKASLPIGWYQIILLGDTCEMFHCRTGQHDDARMCIAIALTAVRLGANVANHTEVLEVNKETAADGRPVLSGARVKDRLTGPFIIICLLRLNYNLCTLCHACNNDFTPCI